MCRVFAALWFCACLSLPTHHSSAQTYRESINIVSWNTGPLYPEGIERRADKIRKLDRDLEPDVLVLLEVTGFDAALKFAKTLGWPTYYGVVTDWGPVTTSPFSGLEAVVISKIPIARAIEYDASVDGHHTAFSHAGTLEGVITEHKIDADGISGIESLGAGDRGTLRVDLFNGLSVFPVHLKSNVNQVCANLGDIRRLYSELQLSVPDQITKLYSEGSEAATNGHLDNAKKRERVIAAVARVAAAAVNEGRFAVIAGDYNTAFEPGKVGSSLTDCRLQNFTCEPAPFPPAACSDADGYDDTLGILEQGLTQPLLKWTVLTKGLPRTYFDDSHSEADQPFADMAIDHIAVPVGQRGRFSAGKRGAETYGSDHFPVTTTFKR